MLSTKLKERKRGRSEDDKSHREARWGWAIFKEPAFLETSGDDHQDARRSSVGRRREPPFVWQGEMLFRHGRDSSVVAEGAGRAG